MINDDSLLSDYEKQGLLIHSLKEQVVNGRYYKDYLLRIRGYVNENNPNLLDVVNSIKTIVQGLK